MTRTSRHEHAQRHAPRPKRVKFNHTFKKAWAEKTVRQIKRQLIATGELSDPALAPPKFEWHWAIGINSDKGGIVRANTKGEARSLIKDVLGLKKRDTMPAVIRIVRVTPSNESAANVAACQLPGS